MLKLIGWRKRSYLSRIYCQLLAGNFSTIYQLPPKGLQLIEYVVNSGVCKNVYFPDYSSSNVGSLKNHFEHQTSSENYQEHVSKIFSSNYLRLAWWSKRWWPYPRVTGSSPLRFTFLCVYLDIIQLLKYAILLLCLQPKIRVTSLIIVFEKNVVK